MKRFLSVALSAALLCGALAVSAIPVQGAADTVRPTVPLVESGFETGLGDLFSANEDDNGKKATITPVTIADSVNAYLHLTERAAGNTGATVQQNIKTQMKDKGPDGKYYLTARIKLDTPGDTAYALPIMHGAKIQLQPGGGERFAVTDEWTTIGKKRDGSYMAFGVTFGELTTENLTAQTWAKFYIRLLTTQSGQQVAYDGDYSLDDVCLWFVPNEGAPTAVTTVGENLLKDGTFDEKVAEPDYYNTQIAGGDSWYVATTDGEASSPAVVKATVAKESLTATDTTVVHNGTGSLHITKRPGVQQSIAVDLLDVVNRVGKLEKGEHYYLSVWVRAEDGETIEVQPIFGCSRSGEIGNGYILPRDGGYVEVTDEWTEVGIKVPGEYLPFLVNGSADAGNFDPYGSTWASIRLATKDTSSFYVDDFKVMGPQPAADAAQAFINAVNALPKPADVTHGSETAIVAAEKQYEGLNLEALTAEQKTAVADAKTKLEAVRAAFDALPEPKKSFAPEFKYENKANLIAPYGDLETFTANDFVWNEENVEGVNPKYTLITDKALAHGGNNCLLISDRKQSQHAAAFTLTDVIKAQGGGKYYFSCWMRTKNPGETMEVFPLLYIGGLNKEYYIDNDTRYTITNEWTYVGVTYDNLDGYFRSNGEEIADFADPATYVALRFYGQNETLESADDGEMYPDYYIDDLKVWKAFDGQADYVDPDAPTTTTTTTTTTAAGGTTTTTAAGDKEIPETGSALPIAALALGVVSVGGVLLTRKRRTQQ